ncbi:MAG TPA: type II toxin-antitoxin system VapC family toxin [Galbitalea sp.]
MIAEQVVVDASVIVTLLIDSGSAGDAIATRIGSSGLHAPAHLPVEVTNVLRRRRNAGMLSDAEATLALQGLWSLSIELWPQEVVTARTWELGRNFSSYDAAYVAVAEQVGGPLLTSDVRLSRAPGAACAIEVFA